MAARPPISPPHPPCRGAGGLLFSALMMLAVTAGTAGAQDWETSGFIGVETRGFWQSPRNPEQGGGDGSLILQPEFRWRNNERDQRFTLVAFARADSNDPERSHVDLREAYWARDADDWSLTVGLGKVFWGVTESRHLVDVINQTDAVEDVDGEDKLGQPMVNLNLQRDWGLLEFYLLPGFRERTHPGSKGRLRTPLPVDDDAARYATGAGRHHLDLAVRYSHYFGDVDIGVHVFDGNSREPRFEPDAEGQHLIPVYESMTQLGVDLQLTREAWLWKFEGLIRDAGSDRFAAWVAGFEYTLYGIRDSSADLGLLAEVLQDGRGAAAPPTPFDNDVFLGARLALNDIADTSVLAGVAVDRHTGETFFNLEAERRLGDRMTAEVRLRAFSGSEPGEALYAFDADDYLQIRLKWYY